MKYICLEKTNKDETMIYDNTRVRRQDCLLDEARAREILASAEYGVLSMVDLEGKPYGIPVNFVWEDDCAYIHCATEGKKLDILECNEDISFCVVGKVNLLPDKFTTEYESLVLTGSATIITSDEERMHALELLLEKLSPEHKAIGMQYAKKSFYRTDIIRLDFTTFSGKCKKVNL